MVGGTGKDHVSAVNLLEGDDEGEFVLEGECAQRPEEICAVSHRFVPSVGGADEEGAARDRMVFEFLDSCGKSTAGELFAALIEKNAVATFRESQHALMETGASFDKVGFHFCDRAKASEIFLDASSGESQRGLPGRDDPPVQRTMGLKSAA